MLYIRHIHQKDQIVKQVSECLMTLLKNHVNLAAIACNTAHEFLDEEVLKDLAKQELSFLHIIKESGQFLSHNNIQTSILLCSNTSAMAQLHKKYFDCVYPDNESQKQTQNLIDKILAGRQTVVDTSDLMQKINQFAL